MSDETMWQPIETAPKDGTPFLSYGYIPECWGYTCEEKKISISYWAFMTGFVSQASYTYGEKFVPTHWMPLPEPPKKQP